MDVHLGRPDLEGEDSAVGHGASEHWPSRERGEATDDANMERTELGRKVRRWNVALQRAPFTRGARGPSESCLRIPERLD